MQAKPIWTGLLIVLMATGGAVTTAAADHHAEQPHDTERSEPGLEGPDARERQRDHMTDEMDPEAEWPDDVGEVVVPEPEPRESRENGREWFAPPGWEDDPALLK